MMQYRSSVVDEPGGLQVPVRDGYARSTIRLSAWLFGLLCTTFLACIGLRIGGGYVAEAVDDLGELLAALMAAAACALTASRQPLRRASWALLGASAFAWAGGETIWSCYDLVYHTNPFPSLADVGFLCAIPLGAAGLILFTDAWSRRRLRRRAMAFGSATAAVLVSWMAVAVTVSHGRPSQALATVLGVAYPLGDLLLISIGISVLGRRPPEHTPLILVIGGLAAFTAADTSFAYLTAINAYGIGNALDTGWVLGYLLIALGALVANKSSTWLPSREEPSQAGPSEVSFRNRRPSLVPDGALRYPPRPARTGWFTPKAADHMINGLAIVLIIADAGVCLYDLALMLKALA